MSYTFGVPELLRSKPETVVGTKEDTGLYIPVEAAVRILLRVPQSVAGQAGMDIAPEDFEPQLRQACAEAMHGVTVGAGFVAESVCVQQFLPGAP